MKRRFLNRWVPAFAGLAITLVVMSSIPVVIAETDPSAPDIPLWFPVGEEMLYDIYWGKLHVGESRVWVEWEEEDGRKLLAIRMRTRSNRVLSTLYPVDDYVESLVDPEPFLPVRFTKQISEGRYRAHEITEFDYAAGLAHWRSVRNGKTQSFPISEDIRDIPTLMYFLRRENFSPGDRREFDVMADEKVYRLTAKALKVEAVRLRNYGRVPSIKIEPIASFGGIFVRKGRMWLWVSTRGRRLATRISVEVPVARVHLYLREVRGPGASEWRREQATATGTESDTEKEAS